MPETQPRVDASAGRRIPKCAREHSPDCLPICTGARKHQHRQTPRNVAAAIRLYVPERTQPSLRSKRRNAKNIARVFPMSASTHQRTLTALPPEDDNTGTRCLVPHPRKGRVAPPPNLPKQTRAQQPDMSPHQTTKTVRVCVEINKTPESVPPNLCQRITTLTTASQNRDQTNFPKDVGDRKSVV